MGEERTQITLKDREELLHEVRKRKKRSGLELGQLYLKNYVQYCKMLGTDSYYAEIRDTVARKAMRLDSDEVEDYRKIADYFLDWEIRNHPYMRESHSIAHYESLLFMRKVGYITSTEDMKDYLLKVGVKADSFGELPDSFKRFTIEKFYPETEGFGDILDNSLDHILLLRNAIYYLNGYSKVLDMAIEAFGIDDASYFKPEMELIDNHMRSANYGILRLLERFKSSDDPDKAKKSEVVRTFLPIIGRHIAIPDTLKTSDYTQISDVYPSEDNQAQARELISTALGFCQKEEELQDLMLYYPLTGDSE